MKHQIRLSLKQFMKVNSKELDIVLQQTKKSVEEIYESSVTHGLVYHLTAIVQSEWYTILDCNANHNYVYIFGDNTMRTGNGGQAIIRDCHNTFGVVTKRFPSHNNTSYLNEDDLDIVKADLVKLHNLYLTGKTIVFPADGIGTGLAKLSEHAPKLLQFINDFISHNFLGHTVYIKD